MLLRGSILCQLAGLIISLSASVLSAGQREGFVPNYSDLYDTRAEVAFEDAGLEYDQVPAEAKERPRHRGYEIPRDTLAKFALEGSYEDEIDALDREYSSPTVYKLDAVQVSDTQKEEPRPDVQYSSSSSSDKPKNKPYKSSYYVTKSKHSKPKKAYQDEPKEEEQPSRSSEHRAQQTEAPSVDHAPFKQYVSYSNKPKATENSFYTSYNSQQPSGNSGAEQREAPRINQSPYKQYVSYNAKPKATENSYQTSYNSQPSGNAGAEQREAPRIDHAPYRQYVSYNNKPKPTENYYQTHSSYNSQPSGNSGGGQSQASQQGDCEEVRKKSGDKNPEMKCVVCKDPKTGSKSEHCSFNSSPEPEAYFVTKSSKYTQPQKDGNQRYKRYTGRNNDDSEFDPYERFKAESQKYSVVDADDFFKEFQFPTGYSGGGGGGGGGGGNLEKSESENQAEQMMKDGGTCREEKKNGMNCKICKNEKTGGNFETCTYSSAPSEKKYAFVSEKKTTGNDAPTEKVIESKGSDVVEKKIEPRASETQQDETKKSRGNTRARLVDDTPYEVPKHFAEETKKQQRNDRSKYYHSRDDDAKSAEAQDGDDYYRKFLATKPGRSEEKRPPQHEDNSSQDVEKVLEEFAKKDRSTCKKAVKNGMTCYLCVRKDGTQHEECMYVTGRQPEKSHVAYHEVEQLKNTGNNNINNNKDKDGPASAASTVREVTYQKRKRPLKKAYSNNQGASSTKVTTTAKFTPNAGATSILSLVNGKFRQPRKLRRTQNYSGADALVQETQNNPVVVRVKAAAALSEKAVEPAAASSENDHLYTDELGVRLPKYLFEKSDFEKSFNIRH